ncbi:hypothetical protein BC628DRAFT_1418017 [Trametes gibbosa]|nr:hypothetical protein BC628DRAFT_1418017 [Trametes gibbosa]
MSTKVIAALLLMTRAQLQSLAKIYGIKANGKSSEIIEEITTINQQQGEASQETTQTQASQPQASEQVVDTCESELFSQGLRGCGSTPIPGPSTREADVGGAEQRARTSFPSDVFSREQSEQRNNIVDDDDESGCSDASSSYEISESPWRPGKVFAGQELQGGPSFVLRLVTEWPLLPGNPEAVENDATANDADTTPPGALHCSALAELSNNERYKGGTCSRPTNAESKQEEASGSHWAQSTNAEPHETRFDTPAKGKRRDRNWDEDESPARRVRRRDAYDL